MEIGKMLLIVCGVINVLIALLHVAVIYHGASAYRYFGAGEKLATMAEQGSWIPAAVTWGITLVFLLFALLNFSQAGWFFLPYAFVGVFVIASVFTLRGLAVLPLLFRAAKVSRFDLISSIFSFGIGLLHFIGLFWPRLALFS